ncbi:hypothetical protein BD413DRAFT_114678 [Trametes elegans]|nr:hypothetical protein BD413DRAFT_114678 [Trametes elegans]
MSGNWTVTIDDTSSFINYQPHGDGGVGDWTSTGWQPWFSDSGGFSQQGGESGSGNSLHITAYSGASLDFQFFGTSIALYGTANCSYDVSVDGASTTLPATNTNGQLYARDGLNEQTHRVTLTAHASNSSMFSFDRADVSRPLPSVSSDTPKPTVISATNTTFIQYQGNWTQKTDPGKQIPSKEHPAPYYEVETAPASLSFSFQGTGIVVNGSRNWGSYTYDVTLDGETSSYNASTMWLIGDSLLFYQDGLNPNTTYNFSLTPRLGSGYKFWINSVTLFSGGIVYDRDGTTDRSAASSTAHPGRS